MQRIRLIYLQYYVHLWRCSWQIQWYLYLSRIVICPTTIIRKFPEPSSFSKSSNALFLTALTNSLCRTNKKSFFLVSEYWKLAFRTGKTGYISTRGLSTRTQPDRTRPVRRQPLPDPSREYESGTSIHTYVVFLLLMIKRMKTFFGYIQCDRYAANITFALLLSLLFITSDILFTSAKAGLCD